MDIPTGFALVFFLYYTFTQICLFYGIDNSHNTIYITFYLFLFMCILVLPTSYQRMKNV